MKHEVVHGDCVEVMRSMDAESVDAIVTDPPYGLGFMGKKWDALPPGREVFEECLRVLKPGGHLLALGGSRTYHRLAVAVEDAGFEIRDQIMWVYGSGFPKSLNVLKAIDKSAGAEREVVAIEPNFGASKAEDGKQAYGDYAGEWKVTAPATPAARQWQGWGTALKPAHEPIVMARKPLSGTVAQNVLAHGTGGINVDGCRVGSEGGTRKAGKQKFGWDGSDTGQPVNVEPIDAGRWPANLIHDGSQEATQNMGDAARYFYCAKASKRDRNEGLEEMPLLTGGQATNRADGSAGVNNPRAGAGRTGGNRNTHPTVKPTDLMRYLVRLVTPPGGTVLDPFAGSGSTGKAAALEGFAFIGIEKEEEYVELARARIKHVG